MVPRTASNLNIKWRRNHLISASIHTFTTRSNPSHTPTSTMVYWQPGTQYNLGDVVTYEGIVTPLPPVPCSSSTLILWQVPTIRLFNLTGPKYASLLFVWNDFTDLSSSRIGHPLWPRRSGVRCKEQGPRVEDLDTTTTTATQEHNPSPNSLTSPLLSNRLSNSLLLPTTTKTRTAKVRPTHVRIERFYADNCVAFQAPRSLRRRTSTTSARFSGCALESLLCGMILTQGHLDRGRHRCRGRSFGCRRCRLQTPREL